MNKHEKLIRQIAEEMARDEYQKIHGNKSVFGFRSFDEHPEDTRTTFSNKYMPAARIAVKHMAEIAKDVWWKEAEVGLRSLAKRQLFDIWLIDRGLIPEAGKEAAEDENS